MGNIVSFANTVKEQNDYLDSCINLALCCSIHKERIRKLLRAAYDDDYGQFKKAAEVIFAQRDELVSSASSFHELLKSERGPDYDKYLRLPKDYEWVFN